MDFIEASFKDSNPDFTAYFVNGFYGNAGPVVNGSRSGDYDTIKSKGIDFGCQALSLLHNTFGKPVNSLKIAEQIRDLDTYKSALIVFSAFSIGDIGFFGVGGEPFVEIAASVKAKSPFEMTVTGGGVLGYAAYLPTYDAFHDGVAGQELTTTKCRVDENVEELITGNAQKMLFELHEDIESSVVKYRTSGKASGYLVDFPVSNAFDGSTQTKWLSNNDTPVWIQADLGAEKDISKITLHFGNFYKRECAMDYDIRVSNDEDFKDFEVVVMVRNNSTCQIAHKFSPVKARYVRIQCFSAYGEKNQRPPAVYEMAVYR
jgi:hypothetical protein